MTNDQLLEIEGRRLEDEVLAVNDVEVLLEGERMDALLYAKGGILADDEIPQIRRAG